MVSEVLDRRMRVAPGLAVLVLLAPTAVSWHDDPPRFAFVSVLADAGDRPVLLADDGFVRVLAHDGRQWALRADGAEPLSTLPVTDARSLARDATGRLYVGDWQWTFVHADGAREPFTESIGGTFGPDGRLYRLALREVEDGVYHTDVHAYDGARHETLVATLTVGASRATFHPDGRLYAAAWDGRLHAIDTQTGATSDEGPLVGLLRDVAFDTAGRVYVVNWRGEVLRRDPGADTFELLARASSAPDGRLAFLDDRLFVAVEGAVGYVRIDTDLDGDGTPDLTGFGAHHPRFELAPPADLVLLGAEDRSIEGSEGFRETRVVLQNEGGSWVRPGWHVSLDRLTYASPTSICVRADPDAPTGCARVRLGSVAFPHALAPGQTAEVALTWDASHAIGTQHIEIRLDPSNARLESDETDNFLAITSDVIVATPVGGA